MSTYCYFLGCNKRQYFRGKFCGKNILHASQDQIHKHVLNKTVAQYEVSTGQNIPKYFTYQSSSNQQLMHHSTHTPSYTVPLILQQCNLVYENWCIKRWFDEDNYEHNAWYIQH